MSPRLTAMRDCRQPEYLATGATAIANVQVRAELIAPRAWIVTGADDTRRRIERDLRDGAQQRLVWLRG